MRRADKSLDCVQIEELILCARVGVLEEERVEAQRLTVSLTLWPQTAFEALQDDIGKAVDYAAVAREVQRFVSERADKLIETLAGAIASHLLDTFPVVRVRVELRKFVLPDVKHVAVVLTRERPL